MRGMRAPINYAYYRTSRFRAAVDLVTLPQFTPNTHIHIYICDPTTKNAHKCSACRWVCRGASSYARASRSHAIKSSMRKWLLFRKQLRCGAVRLCRAPSTYPRLRTHACDARRFSVDAVKPIRVCSRQHARAGRYRCGACTSGSEPSDIGDVAAIRDVRSNLVLKTLGPFKDKILNY